MSLISLNQLNMVLDGIKQKLKNHRGNWEQNDKNADDYIKNRPFYTDTTTVFIVENETMTISSDGGYARSMFSIDQFIEGRTYSVILNGEEYQCVAWSNGNVRYIGNGNICGGAGKGEDVPFACDSLDDGGWYLNVSTAGTYTISISCAQEVVHQIDKKYVPIPDGIVTEDDIHNIVDYEMNSLSSVAFTGNYNDLYNKPNVVMFDSQSLTDAEKATARNNIGAGTSNFSGNYADLTNIPEQVQSDWNENDNTQPSYIIGRTHYEEPIEAEIMNLTLSRIVAQGDNASGYAWTTLDIEDSQIAEDTVIKFVETTSVSSSVNYSMSGKVSYYTCEAENSNYYYEYYVVGNKSFLNGITTPTFGMNFGTNEDTGEKYAIVIEKYRRTSNGAMVNDYPRVYILTNVGWTNLRFKIFAINNRVVQLDEKYIPDTIARISDVAEVSNLIGDTSVSEQIKQAIDSLQLEGTGATGAVRYDEAQSLTPEQMAMARDNIGAISADDIRGKTVTYTWDGSTEGRDSFVYNAFTYYKVSDDVPEFSPDYVVASSTSDGTEMSLLYQGTKCYKAGWAIIVTDTGAGGLPLEGSDYNNDTYEDAELYTARSTGVYFYTDTTTFADGFVIFEYQTSLTLSSKGIFADVAIDTTLSKEGNAADAKAVGDAIGGLETSVSNKVPTSRTINSKALTTDITLTPEDIGAAKAAETSKAIADLNELVGDKSVAEQIADAFVEVYVQNEEPENAPEGSIWVDLDEDGAPITSGKNMANVYVLDARTNDMTTVDFSQYAVGDVVVVTVS